MIETAKTGNMKPSEVNALLEQHGSQPLNHGAKLFELIARPELKIADFAHLQDNPMVSTFFGASSPDNLDQEETMEATEILIKYDGYTALTQLSTEARQKLAAVNPETLAQASRIPGVSPSDISVLLVLLGR